MSEAMETTNPAEAEALKKQGNEAMKRGELDKAVDLYTQAITQDPTNHVLYSNRCAAFMKQQNFDKALEDADTTIKIKPEWPKGYSRKAAALISLDRDSEAEAAYRESLKLDPNNQDTKSALEKLERKQRDIPNPFASPEAMQRLMTSERTKGYMDDPDFRAKIESIVKDPNNLMKNMNDHRVMEALGVIMNVDFKAAEDAPRDPFLAKDDSGDEAPKPAKPAAATPTVDTPEQKTKNDALAEKDKGNAAYKKKDFETALSHYNRAIEIDPTNVTFLTNKAAVYFEQEQWDTCIATCLEAVEKGRDLRSDFKVIAKAQARIGNVYYRQGEFAKAVQYFDHSLAEHRNPDIVKKRNETQKKIKEAERLAYINPELAVEEKEKGNDFFKKADYPAAIKHYNEAIKRNPQDPILYSNRALCLQKLLEFPLALKDCEECIKLDPNFVKGHIRKGHALLGMRDTVKAQYAFQKALELDPGNQDATTGLRKCMNQDDPEARRKAAMADPEVQAILGDPAMQLVLQQMQKNPQALQEHLQNPQVAAKIQRLIESGFISLR